MRLPTGTRKRSVRLCLCPLEDRLAPALFTVTNGDDAGPGSLRDAIGQANLSPGASVIDFLPSVTGVAVTSGTLAITGNLTIEGNGAGNLVIAAGAAGFPLFTVDDSTSNVISVTIRGLTIQGASSTTGGGVFAGPENLTLDAVLIKSNTAGISGGGVFVGTGGKLTLSNSHVTGNKAAIAGGGLYMLGGSSVITLGSTVSGNNAQNGGGIAFNGMPDSSGWVVRNSTLSSNTATTGFGGGIGISGSGGMTIQNSTITANSAASFGGGAASTLGSSFAIESSIVSGNQHATSPDFFTSGTVQAKTSAIGSSDGIGSYTDLGGNLAFGTALGLGTLKNNGGPWPTHAPAKTSPVINAGSNPAGLAFDQRGFGYPRELEGTADIGAIEAPLDLPIIVTNGNDSGPGSLRDAVAKANLAPGMDLILFDPAVTNITLTGGTITITDDLVISGPGAKLLTITGNSAGTVFAVSDFTSKIIDVTFKGVTITGGGNSNSSGGAIANSNEMVTISDSRIVNNTASNGGGVVTSGGSLIILNSYIASNVAFASGGGLNATSGAKVMIEGTTLSNNTASNRGGAIHIFQLGVNVPVIRNSTISQNIAADTGGLYFEFSEMLIQNSTITKNTSTSKGGGITISSGPSSGEYRLVSSIVSQNTGTADLFSLAANKYVESEHSAVGSVSGITYIDIGGSLPLGTDVLLGPLQNNGGPWPTHAIPYESPARNKGANPAGLAFDQRGPGFPREVDGQADIGAVEAAPKPPIFVTNGAVGGIGSLLEAINKANASPGPDVIILKTTSVSPNTSSYVITDDVTITNYATLGPTIQGFSSVPIFTIDDSTSKSLNVTLRGLHLFGGGGGILAGAENIRLENVSISGHSNGKSGGAGILMPDGGRLTLIDSSIRSNTSQGPGGGIQLGNNGELFMLNSEISDNFAQDDGGGVVLFGNSGPEGWVILNSTISQNTTKQAGGGISINGNGSLTVQNSTITANSAATLAAGIATVNIPSIALESTIVSGNVPGTLPDVHAPGTVQAAFSAIGAAKVGTLQDLGGNLPLGTPLGLGSLQLNGFGGNSTKTNALPFGSPAVNAGSNPAALVTDQRGSGFVRVAGGQADIGAFELQSPPTLASFTVNGGNPQRSRLTEITLTFTGPVHAPFFQQSEAITLTRTQAVFAGKLGTMVTASSGLIVSPTANPSQLQLTFENIDFGGVEFGSLADGRWQLAIPSLDYTSPLNGSQLRRLYGDGDGNGTVDSNDFASFGAAFGLTAAGSPFDFDQNGIVDAADFAEFGSRFGITL